MFLHLLNGNSFVRCACVDVFDRLHWTMLSETCLQILTIHYAWCSMVLKSIKALLAATGKWNLYSVYFISWPTCLSGDDGWGDFGLDDDQKSSPQPKASRLRCNNMQQLFRRSDGYAVAVLDMLLYFPQIWCLFVGICDDNPLDKALRHFRQQKSTICTSILQIAFHKWSWA